MTLAEIKLFLKAVRTCTHVKMCQFQIPLREVLNADDITISTPLNTIVISADMMVKISINDLLECKMVAGGSIHIGLVRYYFMRPAVLDIFDVMKTITMNEVPANGTI